MKKFLFYLFAFPLFSTVNEPLRCEVFSGYRSDRIHWHLQEPGEGGDLTYSEIYRNIEYWENGLVLKVIHRDLTFFLRGAYGAFGRGTVQQRYPELALQSNTDGWTADGAGYFGYAINLTAERTYKVLLTPLIGYSAYFEQLTRSAISGTLRLVWNGVFLGGGFTVEPNGRWVLNAGYSYHFMDNRLHTSSVKAKSGNNKGHTGWAQLDALVNPLWRIGVGGQIHYFPSRIVDSTVQQGGGDAISQKLKLRWTSFSGWGQISRQF